ncbi:recombination-associated protein RdgC [Francisellaceae bacterium]|nr:recombination-associated protein RdgC [Francisellaceae bacterium]
MWFKNLTLFECTEKFKCSEEELSGFLKDQAFIPCTSVDPVSIGWVAPIGMDDAPLVHSANGFLMVALKRQEKLVPASIIKEILDEKVEEIELRESRKVRKKEKDTLKDDIYQSLLPRAFSRTQITYAYIDVEKGWLVVNTPSSSKAELLTVELRKAIGSLKIRLPGLLPMSMLMTQWIKENDYPKDLVIEDNCILQDNHEGGGVIRCQRQNLLSEDIIELINSGREVVQLGLSWKDEVTFVVNDEMVVKSLKFLEVIQDQANDVVAETAAERFDTDFAIMTGSLREFIEYLGSIFLKDGKTVLDGGSAEIEDSKSEVETEDAENAENISEEAPF